MTSTINASTTAGVVTTADTSGELALQTAGTTAVTVSAAQNVGIGTSSPATILHTSISGSGEAGRFATTTDSTPFISIYSNGGIRAKLRASTAETALLTQGSTPLLLGTNDTERARFNTTGALVFAGGTTTADGIGITFPATQSASSNANTLDDYVEGTWTPSIGGTATYSVQNGTYTKIGRVVTLHCYLGIADLNTGSTTTISGAPFSCASYGGDAGSIIIFNTGVSGGNFVFLQARIGESASTITFSGLTAAASSSTSSSTVFGTNATMAFTLTYFV